MKIHFSIENLFSALKFIFGLLCTSKNRIWCEYVLIDAVGGPTISIESITQNTIKIAMLKNG